MYSGVVRTLVTYKREAQAVAVAGVQIPTYRSIGPAAQVPDFTQPRCSSRSPGSCYIAVSRSRPSNKTMDDHTGIRSLGNYPCTAARGIVGYSVRNAMYSLLREMCSCLAGTMRVAQTPMTPLSPFSMVRLQGSTCSENPLTLVARHRDLGVPHCTNDAPDTMIFVVVTASSLHGEPTRACIHRLVASPVVNDVTTTPRSTARSIHARGTGDEKVVSPLRVYVSAVWKHRPHAL